MPIASTFRSLRSSRLLALALAAALAWTHLSLADAAATPAKGELSASQHAPQESPTSALLLRVAREGREDASLLLARGLPVVGETRESLFLEGPAEIVPRLEASGREVDVLSDTAWAHDFVLVGLRPDSDQVRLESLGAPLYEEDSLRLLALPRGAERETLVAARVHWSLLPHEPLAPPHPAPLHQRAGVSAMGGSDAHDPLVQQAVDAVSESAIADVWAELVDNEPSGTRFSMSQGCRDASVRAHARLESAGVPAELEHWAGNHAPNVVGELTGALNPEQIYIVIGHLDDMPMWGLAPGANDNASGSVTVLEAARALSCQSFRSTLRFIACTGEELGLLGSDAYAAAAAARGDDIRGVLNFDMNGWEGDGLPGPEDLDLNYNSPSEELALLFADAAATYGTGLSVTPVYCPSLSASDHQSFWKRGYKAIFGITDNEGYCGRGGYYPYYHTRDDTIANSGDPAFFHATIRAAVATLATLAEPFRVTFAEESLAPGATASVLVGDRDLDTNPLEAEAIEIDVWSEREPTPERVTLTERSESDAIFEGLVATTTDAPLAGDGLVSVAAGGALFARYVDALDCDGASMVDHETSALVEGLALPAEVEGLTLAGENPTALSWSAGDDAESWELAGELLSTLHADGALSGSSCLATGLSEPSWDDTRDAPPAGDGYLYLVRARSAAGAGTWGSDSVGAKREPAACD